MVKPFPRTRTKLFFPWILTDKDILGKKSGALPRGRTVGRHCRIRQDQIICYQLFPMSGTPLHPKTLSVLGTDLPRVTDGRCSQTTEKQQHQQVICLAVGGQESHFIAGDPFYHLISRKGILLFTPACSWNSFPSPASSFVAGTALLLLPALLPLKGGL